MRNAYCRRGHCTSRRRLLPKFREPKSWLRGWRILRDRLAFTARVLYIVASFMLWLGRWYIDPGQLYNISLEGH